MCVCVGGGGNEKVREEGVCEGVCYEGRDEKACWSVSLRSRGER